MASYMTASEAFAREKLAPNAEVSTSQTAWADKYRGVRLPSDNQNATRSTSM
jgi:hypothetical protein